MEKIYDVIIIGAGPSGLSAAIYASRGNLSVAIVEKGAPGGKMVAQSKIENWPGDKMVMGADLALRMYEHAIEYGAEHLYGEVETVKSLSEFEKEVHLKSGNVLKAKSVVIATGMNERKPMDVEGILEFEHKGVSYCVICDGPLYGKNPAIVIGGGNSAVEEGAFLASIASEVHVFVRDAKFIAEPKLVEELMARDNVKVHFNSRVLKLMGTNSLEKALVEIDGKQQELKVASVFPYIGFIPASSMVKDLGIVEPNGFIKVDQFQETKVKGIYAVGDITQKEIRQIITATNDGGIAGKILTNRLGK
ncbi:NAD(P)/FAD-dependent oxidoreductase [Mesomycoplasma lagogenitalium]|uniref:FAD-dependent oxidoreductase n=1 Tax=Mesomycoplasma lagogenitalium TaxID=171286 RepID=A0ABY8LUE8_9BACT|nr:FAD-dependent oxidoreductase [Mesomycoplasma lagogenitalium]WGI36860.1 FAD-dependent oxidoreductase [Mesomycoplasma lagogenitalium]